MRDEASESKLRSVTGQLQETQSQLDMARQEVRHYLELHSHGQSQLVTELTQAQERNQKQ